MQILNKFKFKIYVDADACPVKVETLAIATRHRIEVNMVSNHGTRPTQNPLVKNIIVDLGPDAADNWIVDNLHKNDLVITSDILLANRSIRKDANVVTPTGQIINKNNIGSRVATRNLMSEIRSSNFFYSSKEKEFVKSDRVRFVNNIEKIIQTIKKSL